MGTTGGEHARTMKAVIVKQGYQTISVVLFKNEFELVFFALFEI